MNNSDEAAVGVTVDSAAGVPMESTTRELIHTRQIVTEGYKRSDGLCDIEGHLKDIRNHDIPLGQETRRAGTALHEMRVSITIDRSLTILSAQAHTLASPYPGICEAITPNYAGLAGIRIEAGFRREVAKRFGGLQGCTHIAELLGNIGTVAMQTVIPETEKTSDQRPGKIDGCHALESSGPMVAIHYPAWHRKRQAD